VFDIYHAGVAFGILKSKETHHGHYRRFYAIIWGLFGVMFWAETLGDGFIAIDRPERWPDKYRIEMIIGGF